MFTVWNVTSTQQHADFAEVVTQQAPTNLHSLATQSKLQSPSDRDLSTVVDTQSAVCSEVTTPEMIPPSQNKGSSSRLIASEAPLSLTAELQLFSAPLAESEDFSLLGDDPL